MPAVSVMKAARVTRVPAPVGQRSSSTMSAHIATVPAVANAVRADHRRRVRRSIGRAGRYQRHDGDEGVEQEQTGGDHDRPGSRDIVDHDRPPENDDQDHDRAGVGVRLGGRDEREHADEPDQPGCVADSGDAGHGCGGGRCDDGRCAEQPALEADGAELVDELLEHLGTHLDLTRGAVERRATSRRKLLRLPGPRHAMTGTPAWLTRRISRARSRSRIRHARAVRGSAFAATWSGSVSTTATAIPCRPRATARSRAWGVTSGDSMIASTSPGVGIDRGRNPPIRARCARPAPRPRVLRGSGAGVAARFPAAPSSCELHRTPAARRDRRGARSARRRRRRPARWCRGWTRAHRFLRWRRGRPWRRRAARRGCPGPPRWC